MSVSKYSYIPAKCDGGYCPGDCEYCELADYCPPTRDMDELCDGECVKCWERWKEEQDATD